MSGQSANLTLKEACAMQHRIQAGTHDHDHGGGSGNTRTNSTSGRSFSNKASKKPHTDAKYERHSKPDAQNQS